MKSRIHLSPTPAPGGDPTSPEAIVRVVLEKSPLLVYIANLDFKIVLANRSLREVTGYDTSDCPTTDALIERFYPHGDEYQQRVRSIHEGFRRNEHVMGAKLLVQCKDGSQRTIAWYTSRLRIGRGSTVGYIAMGLDLTTQGTLEQWVSLLQRTLQHLSEGVILSDATGGVLAWNEGATRLLGWTEAEMQGQSIERMFPTGQRKALLAEIEDGVTGIDGRYADEIPLQTRTGGSRELAFQQVRLDGEGGVPLARLTVVAPPDTDGDELFARTAALEAQLEAVAKEKSALEADKGRLSAQVSTMDAELATAGAAAGQIADLRGQLDEAIAEAEKAKARVAELESAADEVALEVEAEPATESEAPELDLASLEELEAAKKAAAEAKKAAADAGKSLAKLTADAAKTKSELDAKGKELAAKDEELASRSEELAAKAKELEEAQAAAKKLEEELEAAKKAASGADDQAKQLAELEAAKTEAGKELDEARKAAENATAEATAAKADLASAQAKLEESTQALDDAQEEWVHERSKLEDEHRAAIDALSQKSTEQRRALEAQLHKDILAAEERAEVERQKLIDRFEAEKSDLARAAEIAQAELESSSARAVEEIRAKYANVPQLQSHLQTVGAPVVSADTAGRIIGWSQGAEALEGSSAKAALGKVIFDKVLALEGLKWKTLFGQVVVVGKLDRDVTLLRKDGSRQRVMLRARLVKNETGAPAGVTVELDRRRVDPDAAARADAAVQRLLSPFHTHLSNQITQAFQGLSDTMARVQQLEQLGQAGGSLPLDGLVAQVAAASGGKAVCELGSDRQVGDSGRGLVALLFSLVEGDGDKVISTADAAAPVVVRGSWSPTRQGAIEWLAREGGFAVTFVDGAAHVDLVPPPPADTGAPDDAEETRMYDGPPPDSGALLAESRTTMMAGSLELELDEPTTGLDVAGVDEGELELDPDEDNPDIGNSGAVDLLGGEDGVLEVFAGEDSVIKSHDVVYMKVNSLAEIDPVLRSSEQVLVRSGERGGPSSHSDLPPIDELDELPGGTGGVSEALLHTAGQMDAYVAGNTVADDELEDATPTSGGKPRRPSPELMQEMQSTDADAAAKEPEKPAPKKGSKRRRGRKRK